MSNDENVLLSAIVKHAREPGVTSFMLNGEPGMQAVVDATVYDYHRITGRPEVTDDMLRSLIGQKVTVARTGQSAFGAGSISAMEGTLFMGSRGGIGILPKGKRKNGYVVGHALDVEVGYGHVEALRDRVQSVRRRYPETIVELGAERLRQLPTRGNTVKLVVFGTWRGPDAHSPGAVWLLHSYLPDGDIAEGVLLVRPEHGFSEHGSIYGDQLTRMGGAVVGAVELTVAEAIAMTDLPYDCMLSRLALPIPCGDGAK